MELIRINGNTEVITSLDCALEVVDKYLGQEIARYIQDGHREQVEELEDQISDMYTEDKAIEVFQEPKQAALVEANDALDELIENIEGAKRLNRTKLLDTLNIIRKNIANAR